MPILVISGSEEMREKKKGLSREQIAARGIPTTSAINRPAVRGRHRTSVERSPLLRATIPRIEDDSPSTEAKIRLLLKTANPRAATALFPNLPTMARSINAISKVEP